MSREARELVADSLMVVGALVLLVSLFLPWSHQFSPGYEAAFGASGALHGIPRDPTGWQVYSTADVLLALLSVWLLGLALLGPRRVRLAALLACGLALAFVVHALAKPPTNGADLVTPIASGGTPPVDHPSDGAGETVALAALVTGIAGLAVSLSVD